MSSKEKKKPNVKEVQKEDETHDVAVDEEAPTELEKAFATIRDLETQLEASRNDYLRVFADGENRKKRMMADLELRKNAALRDYSLNLLAVVDNFERALAQEEHDFDSLKKGVAMIYQQLMDVLASEGVVKIEALHQEFDANKHHAITTEESEDMEPNHVMEVFQEGYMFKDKLLRASMVKVSERKSEEE